MPRPLWSGLLSIGLVNIPVQVISAYSHRGVNFKLLREKDHSPIHYKRVADDGKEVEWDHIVRGYEMKRGEYVVFDEEDFENIDPKKSRQIEINEFVDAEELDPIYVKNTYYLLPRLGAEKPYYLFRKALEELDVLAVAQLVMREKERLVAIRPMDKGLQMVDLHYKEEIVDPKTLGFPRKLQVKPEELKLAKQMVKQMTKPFKPAKYKDTYEAKVKALAKKKAKGETVELPKEERVEVSTVEDLMTALRDSVEQTKS